MTNPRVGSGEASTSTVRRRNWELRSHRKRVSGGDDITQLSKEIESSGIDTSLVVRHSGSLSLPKSPWQSKQTCTFHGPSLEC